MLRQLLRITAVIAICLLAGVGLAVAGNPVAQFTGPAGTNPAQNPTILGDLNSLISAINTTIGNYLTFTNSAAETGEMALTNSLSWAPKSNCGSAGAECILVIDETGRQGYIPVY